MSESLSCSRTGAIVEVLSWSSGNSSPGCGEEHINIIRTMWKLKNSNKQLLWDCVRSNKYHLGDYRTYENRWLSINSYILLEMNGHKGSFK